MSVKTIVILSRLMAWKRELLAWAAENDPNKWIAWATIRARAIQATEPLQNPVTTLNKYNQK